MLDSNNNRIAKNSIFLYLRLFISMGVGMFTTRVIIQVLGEVDFGLYNVVGGIVTMFAFVNTAMSQSVSRFLAVALGIGDMSRLKNIFSTSVLIHIAFSVIVVLLAETLGLWLLQNKIQIPVGRNDAVFWVYQFSVISATLTIINVPYTAAIIAHEKMAAFAYLSLLDVIFKLAIVYMLFGVECDKLILYAGAYMGTQIVYQTINIIYCNIKFSESKLKLMYDLPLLKEMLSFAGWSSLQSFGYVFSTQGVNILLNIFWGPSANAARAIAYQVQSIVMRFSVGIQTAFNPQIIKQYAMSEFENLYRLIFRSARMTFFLMFMISFPIFIQTNYLLTLWLGEINELTVYFARVIIATAILDAISMSLTTAAKATGKIKFYTIIDGVIYITVLPVIYVCFKLGVNIEKVFFNVLIFMIITIIARILICCPLIKLKYNDYIRGVFPTIISTSVVSFIIIHILSLTFNNYVAHSFLWLCIAFIVAMISTAVLGLYPNERFYVVNLIKDKIPKFNK